MLAELFQHYQRMVKDPGGLPTGLNVEITRALTGHNRAGLVFLPPDHPAISRDGELLDRWGHPYFFHALSSRDMQVCSSGPDRQWWTADDLQVPDSGSPRVRRLRGDRD